jgi:hypothetical protein
MKIGTHTTSRIAGNILIAALEAKAIAPGGAHERVHPGGPRGFHAHPSCRSRDIIDKSRWSNATGSRLRTAAFSPTAPRRLRRGEGN